MIIASAIIVAAGSSKRMGGKTNKPYIEINGKPMLAYSLEVFAQVPDIKEVLVAVRADDEAACKALIRKGKFGNVRLVIGGKERQDSVANALKKVRKDCRAVLIHDAARPYITPDLVSRLLLSAEKHRAVLPVIPIKDTVKRSMNGKYVDETLDRKQLFLAQTPQVFDYRLLIRAYERAHDEGYYGTDDASLVERLGIPVMIFPGEEGNMKITVKEDIVK